MPKCISHQQSKLVLVTINEMNHTMVDFRSVFGTRGQSPLHIKNSEGSSYGVEVGASDSRDCVAPFRRNDSRTGTRMSSIMSKEINEDTLMTISDRMAATVRTMSDSTANCAECEVYH
jgi:hypothetical protein